MHKILLECNKCYLGFPGDSGSKKSTCQAGYPGSIPGAGRPPGEENVDGITDSMDMSLSKPLELVMDTEAQRPAGHGVPKSQTRLSH